MVGTSGGDREDGGIGGRIHREYRGGGRGSGRYRRGLPHHRAIPPGERRGGAEQGLASEEESQKAHAEKVDLMKHRAHKDVNRGFIEDSRISKQLRRLSREDDSERYLAQVHLLQESVMLNENVKYVRRNADHILDSLFEILHAAPSPPCRWEITKCIGRVGHVMEGDIKRFVDVTLDRLEIWKAPEMKVLVLRCILEMLQLDSDKSQLDQVGEKIVEGLQGILEGTETPEVMVATVDVLRELNQSHSHILNNYFQDVVDILVGWHIDHHQSPEVMRYVSLALQSFSPLWQINVSIATTLLSQFVEDMEDYCEDLDRGLSGRSSPDDEPVIHPSVCAKKVAAFISVFTTVLRCLEPQISPSGSAVLSPNFLVDALAKMISGAAKIVQHCWEEALIEALNQVCLVLVPYCPSISDLQSHFCHVVDIQQSLVEHYGFTTVLSYLALLTQILKQIGSTLPVEFIQKVLERDSPLRVLRVSPQQAVWKATLGVYHAVLALKNVPLLQEAYTYILADIQLLHRTLVPNGKSFTTTTVLEGVSYKENEAVILLMYYMTVLAEVANTRNSIITMWVLNPPLVDLLATHLTPASPHLALHYPEVQHTILYLLHAHCSKHFHYISSSMLVVGASAAFIPPSASPAFSGGSPGSFSGSSTSENFATILSTLTAVFLQRHVTGANILQLCLEWATDIVKSGETSLPQLVKIPLFSSMIEAIIQTGYHHFNSVTIEVASFLSTFFSLLSPNQLQKLDEVISLCLHHVSHKDNNIRGTYFELLAKIPLSSISHALCTANLTDDSEYTANKGDSSSSVDIGSLDSTSVRSLERHFVLRSTSGQLPSNAFHTLMDFILHVAQPKGENWQDDLFAMCQRVDRMTKAEDWSLPVLASHLRTLLWKWLAWEPAQHCIANKLRTTLGKPQDTFTNIEGVIKKRAKEVRECGQDLDKHHNVTTPEDDKPGRSSSDGSRSEGEGSIRVHYLAVMLLVEFVESLEKAMFNASDGCAVAVSPPNKSVRVFFRTNRQTCTEWLSRIRAAVIIVALNCGRPEVAVRHSYKLLQELKDNNNTQGSDFERAVCYCARALVAEGCDEGVTGLYYWCRDHVGRRFGWLKPAIYSAANKYEKSLRGYMEFIEGAEEMEDAEEKKPETESESANVSANQTDVKQLDPLVLEFIHSQVADCHGKLSHWGELQKWMQHIHNPDSEGTGTHSGLLNSYKNLAHVEALAHFDSGDLVGVTTALSHSVDSVDWSKGQNWIMWKRFQDINAVLLHSLTSVVCHQPLTTRDSLTKIAGDCQGEVEWLLQLSTLSSHSVMHLHLVLFHQVLQELQSVLNDNNCGVGRLHEGWDQTNLLSLPADLIPHVSRWAKLIARMNINITPTSIIKLDLLSAKQARKQENLDFAERTIKLLLGSVDVGLFEAVPEVISGSDYNTLQAKLHREAAKILACKGQFIQACKVLSGSVMGLNPSLATLAATDITLLTLPPNETGHLCARSIITTYKWWSQDERKQLMLASEPAVAPPWMEQLITVYDEMKAYAPEELQSLSEVSHSMLPPLENNVGNILTLAATQCPTLPKVWFHMASWCFRWGRRILEDTDTCDSEISEADQERVKEIILSAFGKDASDIHLKVEEMCSLLRHWKPGQGTEEEDELLKLEEVQGTYQVGTHIISLLQSWGLPSNMVTSVSSQLGEVHQAIQERHYAVLIASARAYFRFLKISHGNSVSQMDQCTIATLRLLRLMVKHASELREVLEKGLAETPTKPWKTIIPQLFARLNHPEHYVRGSISELLCRLAGDCPHLIVFPAVVGSTGGNVAGNQASLTDMLAKYLHKGQQIRKMKQVLVDEDDEEDEEEDEEFDQVEEEEEEEDDELISELTEEQERKSLMRDCFSALVDTLTKQIGSSISEVQMLVHELRRITVLWDELWLGTLSQHHTDMSRKCHQLSAEIARLNNNSSLSQSEKVQLIKKKYDIIFKPLLFVLDQLADITSAHPETPHECHFHDTYGSLIATALSDLREPESYFDPQSALSGLRQLQQMLQQRAHRRASATLKMVEVSPKLGSLSNTLIAMPGVVSASQQVVTLASVDGHISILPTKTKPKKLSFQGSDGKKYTYLFKGLEDLHLDERIMQFLEIVNTMLAKNQRGKNCVYRARSYSVVPLGPRSGLIQWVGSATPLFGLYKRWQQREAHAMLLKTHSSNASMHPQAPPQVPRPSELYYSKLTPRLREAGVSLDNRKEWPLGIMRDVLKDLIRDTPQNLLARELWMCSVSAGNWWSMTQTYAISTAVISMIGYVIGLGDRHLDNVLVNLTSGEVIHIDYNVCFEKGKNLRVPEKVPYRMTQNIEGALGVTGTEGIFRSACEQVLRTMRRGRETLLTLLEAFIYDPLVDWTPDSESGYAGAVYGGDQALVSGARQSRQQLERGLTLSMFAVRMAEMKADWLANKIEVLDAIPEVELRLQEWLKSHEAVGGAEDNLQDGHHLMALLKEAEANPQHDLYGLRSRYEEFAMVQKSVGHAKEKAKSRLTEIKQWHGLYLTAARVFESGQAGEWRSKVSTINTLQTSVAPVTEFLTQAGQSQLASQCEHTEVELGRVIVQIQGVLSNSLDLLVKYGSVWMNYPADHLTTHRLSQQHMWLVSLLQDFSLNNVQTLITKSHTEAPDGSSVSHVCNVDMELHNKALQISSQNQKVYERMRAEGLNDRAVVVNTVQETSHALSSLIGEHGISGVAAMTCALLNSLTQLTSARLRADKTAAGTGEGLVDLTVGGLWWLRECMVTLGGMVELVTLLTTHSPPTYPQETPVIQAISALHDVFSSLHELVLNTSGIIIVEGVRLFWRGEPSVVSLATELQAVVTNAPTPPSSLCQQLTTHLRLMILMMPPRHENVLQEATMLHQQLIEVIERITARENSGASSSGDMNQGQMLLMGFHLLFEGVETQLDQLMDAVSHAPLPQPWPRVDTAREAAEIMAPLQDPALRQVLRALLRVKKVQTIADFFTTAYQTSPSFKKSESAANRTRSNLCDEERLQKIVRRYASDCVSLLLLGLPSHLATHLLLLHCQKLGINVSGYIEARDVGTEGRVSLEGIVQEALECCMTRHALDPTLPTSAASSLTHHLNAVRKKLLLRHWEGEAEGLRTTHQRVTAQHLAHQWWYEDILKQRVVAPPVQPNRGSILGDLRSNVSKLLALHQNVAELRDKHTSLTGNVEQRLKWAAGSNPSIAKALEEFSNGVEIALTGIIELLQKSEEVASTCNTVLHYEALRTHTVDAISWDTSFTSVLNSCQESCMLLERYHSSISSQEETLVSLCPLPADVNGKWIQRASSAVSDHIELLTKGVSDQSSEMKKSVDFVRSSVVGLRIHLTTHHKFMSDIRALLKTMAKFEVDGGLAGIEDYLSLYRTYSETISGLIRQMLHDPLTAEKAAAYLQKLREVTSQTETIYDLLVEIGTQCVVEDTQEEGEAPKEGSGEPRRPPLLRQSSVIMSPARTSTPDSKTKVKRHPLTGRVVQEHNAYALNVWRRVKVKLEGRDCDSARRASVTEQVDYTIKEATNLENLATLYEGWTPWV
ncbi:Serine/threonine-protein kinase SMG1 [Chionoecetes opilio]|uniref:non-specific serine/threonine protein kinase n=1 Tax=Chionoecetes opilio TaxID=41210 RepID=A0A8J5CI93_CHIOP|nr:Serine/threonine-protein kinase SMG1 [Chionoecetes opilio]